MDLYNMAVLLEEVNSPSFIALHIVYHLSMIAITVRDSWAFVLYYLLSTAHATFCCSEPYLAHHELESVITIIFVIITFTTVAVIIVVVIVVIIIIIEKYI